MSLLFIDGADHYATAEIAMKWSRASGTMAIDATNPRRTGGRHLKFNASSIIPWVTRILPATVNTLVVGFAFKVASLADHRGLIRLMRKNGATCTVQIETDGKLSVYRGDYNGTLIESSTLTIVTNQWYYIEAKIYVHDSAGTYDVRLNGASIVDGSNVDTKGVTTAGIDQLAIKGCGTSGNTMYVDDLYIDDADLQGDCRVDALWPEGAGNYSQWDVEPSGSDNYENVDDDNDMDGDTTYNSTGVLNELDSYAFDDLSSATDSAIKCVALNLGSRKDDAGGRNLSHLCRMSAADYVGSEKSMHDTYEVPQHIWENPPDAPSESWDDADVNGAEFGVKLTT